MIVLAEVIREKDFTMRQRAAMPSVEQDGAPPPLHRAPTQPAARQGSLKQESKGKVEEGVFLQVCAVSECVVRCCHECGLGHSSQRFLTTTFVST